MMLFSRQNLKSFVVLCLTTSLFISVLVVPSARAQSKLPAPGAHVSDNAEALDEAVKQQLENVLSNLQLRSGINFTIATVKTTEGRDIYDYSLELARAWDIGVRTSSGKSLLLLISVDEKNSITQFSKGIAKQIPEGALGELGQRLRRALNAGRLGAGLLEVVQQLVVELAGKIGFSTEGINQTPPPPTATPEANVTTTTEAPSAAEKPTPSATAPATATEEKKKTDPPAASRTSTAASKKKNTPADDEAEAYAVEITLTYPFAKRVAELQSFLAAHPESKSKARATELLISSRAALGDEKLKSGDNAGGIEQLRLAISDAPMEMTDKLFSGVIAQIPLNLYLRGERSEAFKAAQLIETRFAADPKKLLVLAGFYLGIERGDEAARLAEQATKLAPDMAAAYHTMGLGLHISLRLDEAAAAYKRALELDPKTSGARRSLADLNRAAGKPAEALALYREELAANPADKGARAGLVLSLFDLDQTREAEKELEAALKDDPRNISLLAGAAYWFVAHNDSRRGLEFARLAADREPRYTWGQIALARALVAEKSPEYAEACLRYARQHGRFPTLEYELASTLAAMGLYEEAGEALARSFTLKDGVIETQLANRLPARSTNFIELIAPERRASIFQPVAADTENNARMLKGLLAFTLAINEESGTNEESAVTAGREFAAGTDNMRAYRQLYAARRLLQHGIGFQAAVELADAAREGVDAALSVPSATIAVQADELRQIRAQAIASGGTPNMPDAPRNALANLMRGQIEHLSGWALFNQDKTPEAINRLRRAVGVLPEQTPAWRAAVWHLGTALQQNGNEEEALSYYIKSYNAGTPDSVRRVTIEQLYRKVNGSIEGLDDRIGPLRTAASVAVPASGAANTNTAAAELNSAGNASPAASPTPGPTPTPEPGVVQPTAPSDQPAAEPSPVGEATPTPAPTSPESTPEPSATPTPEPVPTQSPAMPIPEVTRKPDEVPSPTPSPGATPSSETRPRRVKPPGD